MTIKEFIPRADVRAQVDTLTISTSGGSLANGDRFSISANNQGKKLIVTVASGLNTVDLVTAALAVLGEASTDAEFQEVDFVASSTGGLLTITSSTPGVPFTFTYTKASTFGVIVSTTATTATGPNHWSEPNNWLPAGVPIDGDDISASYPGTQILYGLTTGITIGTLNVTNNVQIGLPRQNANGYPEYRQQYLTINVAIANASTSGMVKLEPSTGTAGTVITINGSTSQGSSSDPYAVIIRGGLNMRINIITGLVAIAPYESEVANIALIGAAQGSTVLCGPGVVGATANCGGTLEVRCAFSSITLQSGTLTLKEVFPMALNVFGGSAKLLATGTLDSCAVGPGQIDCTNNASPIVCSEMILRPGGSINDPNKIMEYPSGVLPDTGVSQISAS